MTYTCIWLGTLNAKLFQCSEYLDAAAAAAFLLGNDGKKSG
ncbi:hypothetical protein F383_23463 [Gossypium arboreum]|uniref:Uncharacterized protein n=1 Tax=Gossypium arboreum TaxID=29729 RepID=A0A0B0MKM0_GOSAR|nr:hypothetical protein F383_23463 [Gossypium arboreum]